MDAHAKKRTESKCNSEDSHQITREENKRRNKKVQKQPPINKTAISTHLSIITLNVNELNAPMKRHRVAEWIEKQDPYI